MINKRNIGLIVLTSIVSSFVWVLLFNIIFRENKYTFPNEQISYKGLMPNSALLDFTYPAESSVSSVVYVKVLKSSAPSEPSIFDQFFGFSQPYGMPRESINSGSGVIISSDGYIVTNNHVVDNAKEIVVSLINNKSLRAKLVGADPATDIALLKVDAENLPSLSFGNSDSLRLGEWVLAIGSPYDLRSTVTAGIVSAKGRSLPDASREFKIESFIQTDAAVNPGNSGGALVNIKGELVGINTAIASNTGSYTGYSFAVPSTIAKKVVNDIINHGKVQRALLGVSMQELNNDLASLAGLDGDYSGVYIAEVLRGGAAYLSGIRESDVIVKINGLAVKSPSDIQERINFFAPNDKVEIEFIRKGKLMKTTVTLQGRDDAKDIEPRAGEIVEIFGATLKRADRDVLNKFGVRCGVEVYKLKNGKFKDAGIKEGFIITHINQIAINQPSNVADIIKTSERGVLIEGLYKNGRIYYYGIGVKE